MTLILGWILDKLFGDPQWLPHPIIWFGQIISKCEKILNKKPKNNNSNNGNAPDFRFIYGSIMTICLTIGVFAIVYYIIYYAYIVNIWLGTAITVIGIFYCLAGETLIREVKLVFKAVDNSLEEGRLQVARIVGRDTSNLSSKEIRAAALETLAENLSDGVIAPIFWFAVLGVPGMCAYKMINTMDSMIGYKNERYLKFGCFAAKLDDIVNYIPARITALLMILVAPTHNKIHLLKFVYLYGNKHASPNSGYPESALAGILNCRFGGTHNYFGEAVYKPYIGENYKEFTTADMQTAIQVNFWAEILMIILVVIYTIIY
ncbi:MAG: adenosylcobinamide-phosphate synthase CbiB [Bacteroidales bacterium]